jgi:integrase
MSVEASIVDFRDRKLLTERGNKSRSAEEKERRLRAFYGPVLKRQLVSLTTERCKRLYLGSYERGKLVEHGSVTRPTRFKDANGKPRKPSVASHQAELFAAQDHLDWCKDEGLITKNPAAGVKPTGEPKAGKKQLGEDQANAWLEKACEFALAGDMGAVAAMVAFVVALRASEVVGLTQEQIDSDFTVVRVIRGKTRPATRRLKIPVEMDVGRVLRTCLKSLCAGKSYEEKIFGARDRSWPRSNVRRICRAAGVPLVSAHGLRGTHATLAEEEGSTPENMLRSLGHESRGVQHRSYIEPGATERATQRKAMSRMKVVRGGADDGPIQWRKRGVKVSG